MLYDVVIIGGGVVGCAIARELMRYSLRVVLIEKEVEVGFGTSKSNSGIIHAGHHSDPSTLKGQLEWRGNQMWEALHGELAFGFQRIGELTVALDESERETLHRLRMQGDAKGVTGLELWERDRILREEPNLNPDVVAALYAPTCAVVNPYEACFMLVENAVLNGLELSTNNRVLDISAMDDGLVVRTTRGDFATHFVINAAGLYADEIARMAGVGTFTIQPRKGEEYLLDKRLVGLVKRVIFPCPALNSKGILVIPTYDGTPMVGPTAHLIDDKTDLTTTMIGSEEVFTGVRRLVPGISERDCIAQFAGLRAVADGGDFIIGPTTQSGFINVAGIQSPGLTAAPAIAEMLVDILGDEGLALHPKESFVPTLPVPVRFAALTANEQTRLAEEDRRYARVVCRCELVTEREIIDAARRGASTLDGVKFRTRAGMGRCQGGFCAWRCMELLAQEHETPITGITKRGGDSWILYERKTEGSTS